MRLYWRERRAGQRLILLDDFGAEIEVGAVRETRRGFDALAKTNTYDPGRAQKGFATMEEAKEFVEYFHPWDIFGGDLDMSVEAEVQPDPSASSSSTEATSEAAEGPVDPGEAGSADSGTDHQAHAPADDGPAVTADPEEPPSPRRGWQFWKR
jgi:hypothetical protein